jgi:tetratricopeptide (TPR) repeat protein
MWSGLRGLPSAEQDALTALEFGTAAGMPDAPTAFAAQLASLRHLQGRLDEMLDAYRSYVEAQPHLPSWRSALAAALCATELFDEAREHFDWLRATDFAIPRNFLWSRSMLDLARACSDLGDHEAAAVLYPRIAPVAAQVGVSVILLLCNGSNGLSAGLLASCLGRWEEAERHFEQALIVNERLGARPWLVITRRAYAQMLLDRAGSGDRERAAALIAAALPEAEELSMARELVRLKRLEMRLGAAG